MRELRITITMPLSEDTFASAEQVAKVGEHLAAFAKALDDTDAKIKHEIVSVRGPSKPRAKKVKHPVVAEAA